MADGGDKIPMPARLDAKDAKANLGAVECHPLDQPGQDFVTLIRPRDKPRRCFPHAPFVSALVHPTPVPRPFPVLQVGRCNVGFYSGRFSKFPSNSADLPRAYCFFSGDLIKSNTL